MIAITEMRLQDWEIKGIVSGYRKLVKLDEALSCTSDVPFNSLISFVETLLPAFKKVLANGNVGEDYDKIRELVASDIDDEEFMNILLCR